MRDRHSPAADRPRTGPQTAPNCRPTASRLTLHNVTRDAPVEAATLSWRPTAPPVRVHEPVTSLVGVLRDPGETPGHGAA